MWRKYLQPVDKSFIELSVMLEKPQSSFSSRVANFAISAKVSSFRLVQPYLCKIMVLITSKMSMLSDVGVSTNLKCQCFQLMAILQNG